MKTTTKTGIAAMAVAALTFGTASVVAANADPNRPTDPSVTYSASGERNRGGSGSGAGECTTQRHSSPGQQTPRGRSRHDRSQHVGRQSGSGIAAPAASGVLTAEQRSDLAEMAQEEKVAHDLYVAFAGMYGDLRFDRIAAAETQHLTAVRSMLTAYELTDPTGGMGVGEFSSADWQDLYDRMLSDGSADLASALDVGAAVERADIDDLQAVLSGLDAPDVEQVYAHLLDGSQRHLQAFTR